MTVNFVASIYLVGVPVHINVANDVDSISAGHDEHEWTSWAAKYEVFKFINDGRKGQSAEQNNNWQPVAAAHQPFNANHIKSAQAPLAHPNGGNQQNQLSYQDQSHSHSFPTTLGGFKMGFNGKRIVFGLLDPRLDLKINYIAVCNVLITGLNLRQCAR